jgi:capsular polysaccharide biosynthesis protein
LIAIVPKGTIFTNRVDNISLIVNHQLIPGVSWQFIDGKTTEDRSNRLLTGEIQPRSRPKKIKGSVVSLLSGGGSNYNYYHWLYDSLPRLKLCQPFFQNRATTKFLIPENKLRFQKETLQYLGIHPDQQLSSKEFNHITPDLAIVTSHPNSKNNSVPKWITYFLRENFLHLASGTSSKVPFIYISRDDNTNRRQLINEADLIEILEPYGFQTFTLSNLSFKEQVSLFANAKIIMGVHGAGFANLSFCKKGVSIFELFSQTYQPKMYASISKNLNLNYHSFISSDNREDNKDKQTKSICMTHKELERIEKVLEKLISSL